VTPTTASRCRPCPPATASFVVNTQGVATPQDGERLSTGVFEMKKTLLIAAMLLAPSLAYGANPTAGSPAPAGALAAGFTTLAANYDFSQALYATQSNWLDCNGTNDSLPWHSGVPGLGPNSQVACNILQGTDPSTGDTVMHLQYLATYGSGIGSGQIRWMGMQTKNQNDGYVNLSFNNFYIESVYRIKATNSDGATGQLDGPNSLWLWNDGSRGGSFEINVTELYADRGGYANAGANNHEGGGGISYQSYEPNNLPQGYSETAYHKYGALVTSDGSTHTYMCSFVDDIQQGDCLDLNIADTDPTMFTTKAWLILSMENHSVRPSANYDLYVKYINVWTCPAIAPCNGWTLFNNGSLIYWH